MNKQYAITKAVEFLFRRGYTSRPEVLEAIKAAAGYDGIRTVMSGAIFGSVFGVLSGGSVEDGRSRMAASVARAYTETVDIAYQDGGGELPIDEDTAAWARGAIDAQFGYIDQLFDDLKQLRKDDNIDPGAYAQARADGYTSALDGFYGEAKMRGSKNITLEFGGDDGKESCPDCKRLKGKRHKIQYILDNGLVPHPGNENFECGGWKCEHYWFNPKTGERFDA